MTIIHWLLLAAALICLWATVAGAIADKRRAGPDAQPGDDDRIPLAAWPGAVAFLMMLGSMMFVGDAAGL